jgi:protein-S-isoprenylcysteine O-methyltransferase Ste14
MVRGFRPHGPSWLAGCRGILSWCLRVAVRGSWHDDRGMTHDPTAVCYYIPVEERAATRFKSFAEGRQQPTSYRVRPTGSGDDNCVSAAARLLLAFAEDAPDLVDGPARGRIEDIARFTLHMPGGARQGHMMRNVLNNFRGDHSPSATAAGRVKRFLTIAFYTVMTWFVVPAAVVLPSLWLDGHWGLRFAAPAAFRVAGAGLTIVSGLLAVASLVQFRRLAGELPISAFPSKRLAQSGLYRMWRHPFYLFYGLAFAGLGLMTGSGGLLLVMFPALVVFELWYIAREERGLLRRFGDAYVEHRRRTPLLIPRLRSCRGVK